MDIHGQIEYWKRGAEEDFAAAQSLLEKVHLRHCLFFAHLAIEKMLKAHVTRKTDDVPPRIHNLIRLVDITGLKLDVEQKDFLREFGVYQLEGRYPDSEQLPLNVALASEELAKAREILKWLKNQL
jgi:HEPN domain-containing protein